MSPSLGFDVGTRRIGVAVGNALTVGARPLDVLDVHAAGPDWEHLDRLIHEWQPADLVVGLPLTLEGGEQAITRAARDFAARIGERYRLPVHLVDERHSSQEAARRFAAARAAGTRRRRDAHKLDAVAAAVILEAWFAHPDATASV